MLHTGDTNACINKLPPFSNQIVKNPKMETQHYLDALTGRLIFCCTHQSARQRPESSSPST